MRIDSRTASATRSSSNTAPGKYSWVVFVHDVNWFPHGWFSRCLGVFPEFNSQFSAHLLMQVRLIPVRQTSQGNGLTLRCSDRLLQTTRASYFIVWFLNFSSWFSTFYSEPVFAWRPRFSSVAAARLANLTWLILPVVICLSQRLSHACLSISSIQRNCEWLIITVMIS